MRTVLVQMQYLVWDIYSATGVFRFRAFSAKRTFLLIDFPVFLLTDDDFDDFMLNLFFGD